MAKDLGLMNKGKTVTLQARLPELLIKTAKAKTGARSNAELLRLALAYIATDDEYMTWLISQRGAIPGDLDLDL